MSFKVEKLEDGRIKLSGWWTFEPADKDALDLFAELSVQRGEQLEQARIIKLLEEQVQKFLIPEWDSWLKQEVVNFDIDGLIALIKGEQE